MGRRAKKAPVVTKKRPTLAKRFKCPFCANEGVVECKMDFKEAVGSLSCRLCGASYQMPIHNLHEPVDVFSEWLDDCEAAANQQQRGGGLQQQQQQQQQQQHYDDDDLDDDDLDDDIPGPSLLQMNNKSSKKKKSSSAAAVDNEPQQNYSALGLDDSDDSDDD